MRVFELAKKLGMESKALVKVLHDNGISAANHMSALDPSDVERITKKLQGPVIHAKKTAPATARHESRDLPKSGASALKKAEVEKPAEKKPRMLLRKKAKAEEPLQEPPVSVQEMPPPVTQIFPAPSGEPPVEPGITSPIQTKAPAEPVYSSSADAVRKKIEEPAYAGKGSELAPPMSQIGKPEEKAKKKGAEEEAKEALKAGKDRFKKGNKKTKWGTDAVLSQVPSETREWQDFKPIHKRDDRRGARKSTHTVPAGETTKPRKKVIRLEEGMTVKELAELLGVKGGILIGKLMEMGSPAALNQTVNLDAASLIAESYGVKAEVVQERTEEDIFQKEDVTDTPEMLKVRPPVVTIMGHVDHGKTSLLDAIRETRVTESEAGGITQHIGAYLVNVGEKKICFLDTPGHEAFTAMRSRGAKVTDIVVLVVAADDGVMPQTVEAINHAKAADVPIIVAINKIDKPEANVEKIRNSLSEYQLISEAWGGDTIFVEVSAKKKTGLDTLLEMILLQAELLELKANYDKPGKGTIIEAKLDRGRGPVATVLISEGKIKIGDYFVTGIFTGKVRALINDRGQSVKESGPSTPVEVIGLDGVPQAGDSFVILKDEKAAREIAATRALKQRVSEMGLARKVTLTDLFSQIKEGDVKELNLIIKGDVQGSVEALKESLMKLSRPEVKVGVIHIGVGGITESDVLLASASNAIIIGFNVTPESKASQLAEREKVDIRFYNIIYNAVADVQAAMEGLLAPTLKERVLGRAEVRQTFNVPKMGTVAGCYVLEGTISRAAAGVRLIRDSVVICDSKISSLRRFKDDVKEVQAGYECGIGIENYNDIKLKDIIEAYAIDKIAGKLSTLEARPRTEEKEPA